MKKGFLLIIVVILIFAINNFVRSIYTLWSKRDLVVKAQKELEDERRKNQELKKRLSLTERSEFVEEQARNKLFWTKEGEHLVILPKSVLEGSTSAKEKKEEPNWKKWWKLFF